MENINVDEELNGIEVEDVISITDSGRAIKVAAGVCLTTLGCVAVYRVGKLVNEKVVKPAMAKFKAKNEPEEVSIEIDEDSDCDLED